jgi:2-deoxy-D-gluconate 3-dehydrogenase
MSTSIQEIFNLSNKVAIVTGGAMGIGKGIALRLSEAGASLLIADIYPAKEAEIALKEIRSKGGNAEYLEIDLSKTENLQLVVNEALKHFGNIHFLINNAGIFNYMPVTNLNEELWDKTINLNLKSVAFLSKLVMQHLINTKQKGKIINISSVDSLKPTGNLSHYDASKGGVRMLTRSFAKEAGKYGITVNDIAPGGINTPGAQKMMSTNLTTEQTETLKKQSEAFVQMIPLQRMGEPDDIGKAALFLCSAAADYITGSTLIVDGGLLLM